MRVYRMRRQRVLYRRFAGRCFYCDRQVLYRHEACGGKQHLRLTRDHLIPRSRGGSDGAANIVAACYACNNRRGCRPWLEFLFETRGLPFADY